MHAYLSMLVGMYVYMYCVLVTLYMCVCMCCKWFNTFNLPVSIFASVYMYVYVCNVATYKIIFLIQVFIHLSVILVHYTAIE